MTQMNLILPRVTRKAAEMMDRFLIELQDGSWHKGSDLATRLHTSDRVVRMCAERCDMVISGNRGYKLQRDATQAEYFEWENRLRSQAREMLRRVVRGRIRRNRQAAA